MANPKKIEKNLITMEDLAQGVGQIQQTRNGKPYILHKVDVPIAVQTEAEVIALDTNVFTRARVYYAVDRATDFVYDPNALIGLPSNGTGKWISFGGASGGSIAVQTEADIPTTGLVNSLECYIIATGQTFIYVVEEGASTGQWTEKDQIGDDIEDIKDDVKNLVLAEIEELKAESPPVSGTYARGTRIYNSAPIAGSYIGWVCTTAGTPGIWRPFGLIES